MKALSSRGVRGNGAHHVNAIARRSSAEPVRNVHGENVRTQLARAHGVFIMVRLQPVSFLLNARARPRTKRRVVFRESTDTGTVDSEAA